MPPASVVSEFSGVVAPMAAWKVTAFWLCTLRSAGPSIAPEKVMLPAFAAISTAPLPKVTAPVSVLLPPWLISAPAPLAPAPFSVSASAIVSVPPLRISSAPDATVVPEAALPRPELFVTVSVPPLTSVAPL